MFILCLTVLTAYSEATTASSDPSIIYWKTTTGYGKGYGASWLNNVYKIQYSTNYVYGIYIYIIKYLLK